jgi:hypothetical protein
VEGVKSLHGDLPDRLIERFCEAIAYSKEERTPTNDEVAALQAVLTEISTTALRAGVPPERMLIELKATWTRVCQREPGPDIEDPYWNEVVSQSLAAYESARVRTT